MHKMENTMRELNFNEVEEVSGGNFFQFLFPAHTAQFSRDPIGGSPTSQIQYANTVNLLRETAATTAAFFGPRGVNVAVQQVPIFVFNDPWSY